MARTPPARLRGQRPLLLAVATVVLAAGVQVRADRVADGSAGSDPVAAPSATAGPDVDEDGTVLSSAVVGPPQGAPVDAYVADRRAALADAPADVDVAVVSFDERRSVADALGLAGDELRVRAVLLRLPLEGAAPMTIAVGEDPAGEVAEALERAVEPLRSEEEETQQLLDSGTVTDEAFLEEYESRVTELRTARLAASGGATVHAVVVQGPLAALQALQERDDVRLVDPAPVGTGVAQSTFHGLQPSDTDTVAVGRG